MHTRVAFAIIISRGVFLASAMHYTRKPVGVCLPLSPAPKSSGLTSSPHLRTDLHQQSLDT